MSRESIFNIAYEMLVQTNIFPKDISEIRYTSRWQEEPITLLGCVEEETKKCDHRFRGKSERNLQIAYKCIAAAMVVYLESYPAVFSFKQQTREYFEIWLDKIKQIYNIADATIPEELKLGTQDRDAGIAMLKLLHAREGVTYEEMKNGLGRLSPRSIQKDLIKISPSLYKGNGEPDVPFRLGGQPLLAEIELINPNEYSASKKRFRTLNSVHPLVLQENIMQLATLLKALAAQYFDQEDDVSRIIAVDIWSQMSPYARKKIIDFYAFDDITLADFIFEIDNPCPDDHGVYRTEKELLQEIEMPVDLALPYLIKAPGRTGTIKLITGEHIVAKEIYPISVSNGSNAYRIIDDTGRTFILTKDKIQDVIIHR